MDSAIRSLNELRLGSADQNSGSAAAGVSDVAAEGNVHLQSQGSYKWFRLSSILIVCMKILVSTTFGIFGYKLYLRNINPKAIE